jgi:hypothetical protein
LLLGRERISLGSVVSARSQTAAALAPLMLEANSLLLRRITRFRCVAALKVDGGNGNGWCRVRGGRAVV